MNEREKFYSAYLSLSDNPTIEEAFDFAYQAATNQKDKEIAELKKALGAMLTEMGMDEDEHNKPTFNQARMALRQ